MEHWLFFVVPFPTVEHEVSSYASPGPLDVWHGDRALCSLSVVWSRSSLIIGPT